MARTVASKPEDELTSRIILSMAPRSAFPMASIARDSDSGIDARTALLR